VRAAVCAGDEGEAVAGVGQGEGETPSTRTKTDSEKNAGLDHYAILSVPLA